MIPNNLESTKRADWCDHTAFLDPKMPHDRRCESMIHVCNYTKKAMMAVAIVVGMIHYCLGRQGSPLQRACYPLSMCIVSHGLTIIIKKYPFMVKHSAQLLLAFFMVNVTEMSLFVSPTEYKMPGV